MAAKAAAACRVCMQPAWLTLAGRVSCYSRLRSGQRGPWPTGTDWAEQIPAEVRGTLLLRLLRRAPPSAVTDGP